MIALTFADKRELKKSGRNFNCNKCDPSVQKIRRCHEPRWDFTPEDGSVFPIGVGKGGPYFGFCPGKATWDQEAATIYRILEIVYYTGEMPDGGTLLEQSEEFIDQLHMFLPLYDDMKFYQRQKAMWGSGDKKQSGNSQANKRARARPVRRR